MTRPFEIVVGTYEQYLLGYKIKSISKDYELVKSFATHSHFGSVRSVCSGKYYLTSAGSDDSINLYDLRYRIESGKLVHHNDTVNCVAFTPDASHLFSCSNDGSIAAVRCGNWQLEKHWTKAHKGLAVNALAIHPSGKIALSVGADGALRTWNLIKGRQAYATNLFPRLKSEAKNVNIIGWSPNGQKYLLAVGRRIHLYSVALAAVECEIILDSKIICVEFLNDDLIAIGLENGRIKFYDVKSYKETLCKVAHDVRVKCIAHNDDLLITASSSGEIKLWRYTETTLNILQSTSCGARITCLSLVTFLSNNRPCKENDVEYKKKSRHHDEGDIKSNFEQQVTIEYENKRETSCLNHLSTQSVVVSSNEESLTQDAEECSYKDKEVRKKKKLKNFQNDMECKKVIEEKTMKKRKARGTVDNERNNSVLEQKGENSEMQFNRESMRSKQKESKSTWLVEDNNVPSKKRREKTKKRNQAVVN